MNKRLKKLTALLLSIVMVFSMVTEAFPSAFAAEEGSVSTPTAQADTRNFNFGDSSKTRRPGLYVDFLGDNWKYQAPMGEQTQGTGMTGLTAPGTIDQSKETNGKDKDPTHGTENQWTGYKSAETISGNGGKYQDGIVFWVAVGIDRMTQLELLKKNDNGVYGMELGFYYDSRYIEPYTGGAANDNAGYLSVIQEANLSAYDSFKWDGYTIVDARTDLTPYTDLVTQEVLSGNSSTWGPTIEEILGQVKAPGQGDGEENPWKMTYVSLERDVTENNRFQGIYNENYDPENETSEDTETKYLMLLPFKLKEFDPRYQSRVCLRLARSAGLLSMGSDEGDTPYAAWERVTTRNPGRELKLMTNFQGDLNIFDGKKYLEPSYEALLKLNRAGGDQNSAVLTVENDPSPIKVSASEDGETITGLYGGTGMHLNVHVDAGFSVTVKVYYTSAPGIPVSYSETWINSGEDGDFTFVMPEQNVTVEVTFQVTSAEEFRLHLSEVEQDATWTNVPADTDTGIRGNGTVLTATYTRAPIPPETSSVTTTVTVDKDSPTDNTRHLPAEMVHAGAEVRADIQVHKDYEAVVQIYNVATDGYIAPKRNTTAEPNVFPADGSVSGTDNVILLPTGGTIYFDGGMPQSNVVVYVTYRPATRYKATLEVHHQGIDPSANNVAQLRTTVYTKENQPQTGYSGVVFEDKDMTTLPDRHRQLKDLLNDPYWKDHPVIDLVDASSADGSKSLGGDGRSPMAWDTDENSLMALLAKAATADDLKAIQPLDLRWNSSVTPPMGRQPDDGLRKNALGERYTDSEMDEFYARLLKIKELADKAIADEAVPGGPTSPVKKVNVPASGGAAAYDYYDLTWQQVQAYLLEYEIYEAYLDAKDAYDAAVLQYNADKDQYDINLDEHTKGNMTAAPRVPVPPTAPAVVNSPTLKDKTAAAAFVGGYTWYQPSTATTPPTLVNKCTLEVRPGRKMAVVLEAESTYTVVQSIIIKDDPANTVKHTDIVLDDLSGKLVSSKDHQNEFLFDMPEYDCIVEVTYTKRNEQDLTLRVVGDYEYSTTNLVADNKVKVTGYKANAGSVTAAAINPPLTKDTESTKVLEGSKVSVLVNHDTNYSVSAAVQFSNAAGLPIPVTTDPSNTVNMIDGTLFTFTVPQGATTITVTYTNNNERHNAHLDVKGDSGNTGEWRANHSTLLPALEGEHLLGDIHVAKGYYIYSVRSYTRGGESSFPVTLSGNGWNNGAGGDVTVESTMPDEEYWVEVDIRKGPPEPEPGQILTLRVNDPDNTGTTPADNWAKAEIYRDGVLLAPPPSTNKGTLGPLGMGVTGNKNILDWGYSKAGDLVRLTLNPASGYSVKSVEVNPAGLGVSLTWISPTEAEFIMPAASAEVVVTFQQGNEGQERLYLHLDKTENGVQVPDNSAAAGNRIPSFTSPTIPGGANYNVSAVLPSVEPTGEGTTGAAKPGELVEVNLNVAPGWYIYSLTVSGDQGRISYQLYASFDRTSPGTAVTYDPYDQTKDHYSATDPKTAVATFVMPNSDAYVTVNYQKAETDPPEKDESEHEVELVVVDPENVGTGEPPVYADNYASAVVSGIGADRAIAAVGKGTTGGNVLRRVTSARAGEEVTIDYAADTGYALEIILVTPSGLHVPVNYLSEGKARFTMPDSSVTAIVRFKKEPAIQYTANLVLHFPDGTAYENYDKVGEGSFLVPPTNGLDYPNSVNPDKLYSLVATPGQRLDFDLLAHDGYYIDKITVGPSELGVEAPYTGSFGRQSGYAIMPAANIQINVYFKEGWPDDIKQPDPNQPDPNKTVDYDLTLKVYDAAKSNSSANFASIAGAVLSTPNSDPVKGGGSLTIQPAPKVYDEDRVVVELHPDTGCYAQSITVTDSRGKNVPWMYVPGGIAFEMTPAHVTVTVKYAKLPETNDPNDPYKDYTVTLYTGMTNGTAVTYGPVSNTVGSVNLKGPAPDNHQIQTHGESFTVTTPPHGQTLELTVTPKDGYHVAAAYAVRHDTGEQLLLPMVHVYSGGVGTFAMPEGDVDVYVVFADDSVVPGPDPARGDRTATLIVAGPGGSGSAIMHGEIRDGNTPPVVTTPVSTRDVEASGADSLFAPQGTEFTVDLTVNRGFGISAIRVTDSNGIKVPYRWTDATQRHFTVTMPATGDLRVYVELEEVTPRPGPDDPDPDPEDQLTAQVVVNNGGGSGNKATLRYGPKNSDGTIPVGTDTGALLTPVYAGDQLWVDITVQVGYKIEYVKITPTKYGIHPTLTDLPEKSQDTSFVMPGEDVVVYVKFVKDNRDRKIVELVAKGVEDPSGVGDPIENQAVISSPFSGARPAVHPQTDPKTESVQAAPATATLPAEWVTVDYTWADGYYITSITAVDASNNPVPFTQTENKPGRKGQITFPMVDAKVTVTIEWGTEPKYYDVVLHVIDLDGGDPNPNADSWGQLTWLGAPAGLTDKTSELHAARPEATETLQVRAGDTVQVDADAQTGTYIQAAFVLYRKGGQMIRFNFDPPTSGVGFIGHQTDTFIMHPDKCDVYIYYTKDPQLITDYAAVLMLDSPADDNGPGASTATITRTRASGTATPMSDTVTANDTTKTHGYVTAHDGDTITVEVTPAPGYSIESILMTPLGLSSDQGGSIVITRTGNTYRFTMPNQNVAVRVKLKKGNDTEYRATLHYQRVILNDKGQVVDIENLPTIKSTDWAQFSFTKDGTLVENFKNGGVENVPESTTVTVGASITAAENEMPDYVLAAYVLQENGDMVPLTSLAPLAPDPLEGLTETHTNPNPLLLDGEATFTMPAADVHIYVWFTDNPPEEPWRTAVLTVVDTDPTNPANNNSGLNTATLESSIHHTTPITVWSTGVNGRADMPEKKGHQFIWVTKGETVIVKSQTPAPGYSFLEASITHSDGQPSTAAGHELTQIPAVYPNAYNYTVGEYNSAVVVEYVKSEVTRNALNVVLIDKDNPGDGVTTNKATVTPGAMTALNIQSVTASGARQKIPGVLSGTNVTYQVKPYTGYTFIVQLKDSSGKVLQRWNNDNHFSMPNEEATLEIIYFRSYTATLSVVYTGDKTASGYTAPVGQMVENAFGISPPLTVTADGSASISVPNGTKLTAKLTTLGATDRLIGAILITTDGSRWIAAVDGALPDIQKEFTHTINRKNAEIRLVVGPEDDPEHPENWDYLATVSAVNLPAGTKKPGIAVTDPGANATHGDDWTVANKGNTVTVTVEVPYGYKAVLSTVDLVDPNDIDGKIINGPTSTGGEATTFTMPANNVHVTVTYVKTRFEATLRIIQPTGMGRASLSKNGSFPLEEVTTDSAKLTDLAEGNQLDYNADPDTGYVLKAIFATTASGVTTLLDSSTLPDTYTMPAEDVTITVIFDEVADPDDPKPKHHIAYVTTKETDGLPGNAAQNIKNMSNAALDTAYGTLFTYGDNENKILVNFTTELDYTAVVTARRTDLPDTDPKAWIAVTQQGNTGVCTATLTMPDADVEVIITYYGPDDPKPKDINLTLRLVGHDGEPANTATLTGGSSSLTLAGSTGAQDPLYSNKVTAAAGASLDLDAWRESNYVFERMTVAVWNGDPTDPILFNEVDLSWTDYLLNGVSLLAMPNAETLVTVYYRQPYKATFYVVDAAGNDYNDNVMPMPGPANTNDNPHNTRVPTVTMSVDRTDLGPAQHNPTTWTHTSIENLNGNETVTTVVDLATMPTAPIDSEIASVIATTGSGTVHLAETAGIPGEYLYLMSDSTSTPVRRADDVDITVILRDKKAPKDMYTATVYKVGHDNKAGNWATIEDPTTPTLPKGDIWTGAYEKDEPVVKVTTAPGYYAIVTAVQTGTTTNVPVLQWVTTGDSTTPIEATFKMPAHDVDVTVTYVKDKPQNKLTLTLEDHGGEEGNKGAVYNYTDPTAPPDPDATPAPTPIVEAKGSEAPMVPATPPPTPKPQNPFSKVSGLVDVGDYLLTDPDHAAGYYIESVTLSAAGFDFDLLNPPPGFIPRLPVGGATITIKFGPGKQSGRPFDPEHSTPYNGVGIWTDTSVTPAKGGNYPTVGDDSENPNLTVAPKKDQEGWILADSTDAKTKTVVVTIPTLYDEEEDKDETVVGKFKGSADALYHAGVDPAPAGGMMDIPPTYQFYWWDETNSEYVPFTKDDISILKGEPLSYVNNPKGDYPRDTDGTVLAQHYGYRLTLQVVDGATSDQAKALADYIENGGEIYVTATRPGYVPKTNPDDPDIPWVESEKTQIIIRQNNVLRPYDPDRVNPAGTPDPTYEDHWIRAENRGDYLLVTVPMLNSKAGDNPTEVDGTKHRLQLHLQVKGDDRDSDIINVSDLLNIQNVREYENFWNVNLEYDPNWKTDPNHDRTSYLFDKVYENEIYYHDPSGNKDLYHGARFAVEILTDKELALKFTDPTKLAAAKETADILRHIFDNYGTMNPGDTVNNDPKYQNCRMYITSDEVDTTLTDPLATPLPTFRKDDYTDFEVPRYYSLAGVLQSWAPTHVAELTLYKEDTSASAAPGTYLPDPWLKIRSGLCETMSSTGDYPPEIYNGHWSMDFAFKSSELASLTDVLTYQMVVEKTSHLTYTHTAIELNTGFAAPLYDGVALKFSFSSPISLFCGDIAPVFPGPDQKINDRDRDILAGFNYGLYDWTEDESGTGSDWDNSTFNPYSNAYAADLNGDGIISEQDMAILMSEFNWERWDSDYGTPAGLGFGVSSGIMLLLEDFLDGEAIGDEVSEDEQPTEDADQEGAAPEVPVDPSEDPEGTENAEDPDHTEESQEPVTPEDPEGNEDPDTPEDPEGTTEPVTPDTPKEPDGSTENETPDVPKDPDGTDMPEVPEKPADPLPPQTENDPDQTPAAPETPSDPEDPVTPGKSEGSDSTMPSDEPVLETPDAEGTEPKLPDVEKEESTTQEKEEENDGGEAADPVVTTDSDQYAEKSDLSGNKL